MCVCVIAVDVAAAQEQQTGQRMEICTVLPQDLSLVGKEGVKENFFSF